MDRAVATFPSVYLVLGETGSGKTSFAIDFAKKVSGEIINIDLSQIYSFLKVGTGQIPHIERASIVHHFLGFIDDPIVLTIFQMRTLVEEKIIDVFSRGRLPILVGGSHFFALSLFFAGASFLSYPRKDDFYKKTSFSLCDWFPYSERIRDPLFFCPRFDYSIFVLQSVDQERRESIIKKRIDDFFAAGWLEEIAALSSVQLDFVLKKKFIGYPEIISFLEFQSFSMHSLRNSILIKTLQYAKRQRTFLRKIRRHMEEKGISFRLV